MTAPGDSVSLTALSASPNKPRWLTFSNINTLAGTAELPSGYKGYRIMKATGAQGYDEVSVTVDPVSLPSDDVCPWRAMIYAPDGSYIICNGLPDYIPTMGTPRVRLTDNGPSRAILRIPVTAGILKSTFAKWSDSHAEAVARGMEMTVEYRTGGQLVLAFRGRIFEIESGDEVVITAYDRLMDLALYSDQYLPDVSTTYVEDEVSLDRTASGGNYIYTMDNEVGQVNTAYPVDTIRIDSTADQSVQAWSTDQNDGAILIHNLPAYNGYTVTDGMKIHRLAVDIGTISLEYATTADVTVTFYVYTVSGGTKTLRASWSGTVSLAYRTSNQVVEVSTDDLGLAQTDLDYTVADASTTYIGISFTSHYSDNLLTWAQGTASGSHLTTSTYYQYSGGSWSSYTGAAPEIAVDFDYIDTATDISGSVSVSGAEVTLAQGTAPTISDTYVSTISLEAGVCLSYYITGAIALQTVVSDLIAGAGCVASIPSSLGLSSTTYYTSATYDYLTCIHELIREADAGLRDSLTVPGTISVLPRHTVDETAVETFSTDPADGSEQSIVAHSLTARWMAEKATVAILAENATTSGLPIALETDDWLMSNSLVTAIGSPMRSVTADASSGTHALLANAVGGKVVQLHTNVVEGAVTLAGYRPDLWDLNGSGEGGLPIALTVPEYGISDMVAIPTEMEIGDGVTVVTLDNIRRADRSEVAVSMGLTADAISSASTSLPDTVWVFGRMDKYVTQTGGIGTDSMTRIHLDDEDGNEVAVISSGTYLRLLTDNAGYTHAVGVIPAADVASAFEVYAAGARIYEGGGYSEYTAVLDVPKYVIAGQNVHVDIRYRAA